MRSLTLLLLLLAASPTHADPICSLTGELGKVSREWERLSALLLTASSGFLTISSSGGYWSNTCGGAVTLPETPKDKRERAARLVKEAEQAEHRERTETRWRELVRACTKP